MTYEEFMDDMDSVEINEAVEVSGIANKTAIVNGQEVTLVDWIWEEKKKPSFRHIKG